MNKEISDINKRIVGEIVPKINEISAIKESWQKINEKFGNKLLGNVISRTLRRYMINISNYYNWNCKISECDSFIEGCPIEWDLLVLKKNAISDGSNIYQLSDVLYAVEFKTSGTVDPDYKNHTREEFFDDKFGKHFRYLRRIEHETNHKIPFVYITFSTVKDWFDDTKIYFDKQNKMNNTAFAFLDDRQLDRGIISYIDECYNFEKFLFDLLKEAGV